MGIATDALTASLALDHFFTLNTKAALSELRLTNASRWTCVVDVQSGNKATIRSLVDRSGCEVIKPKRMCEAFQRHVSTLRHGRKDGEQNWLRYVPGRTATTVGKRGEVLRKAYSIFGDTGDNEVCMSGRFLGLDGLINELYISMPDLSMGPSVYWNWQQNGKNPSFVCRVLVTLLRKTQIRRTW